MITFLLVFLWLVFPCEEIRVDSQLLDLLVIMEHIES